MTAVAYATVNMHPWFRMPSLKRKAYSTDSSDSNASSDDADRSAQCAHGPKRRKCEVLETGIAQLSLDPSLHAAAPPYHPQPHAGPSTARGWTTTAISNVPTSAFPIVLHPGAVEEPTSPAASEAQEDAADVKMKGTSWYEPEKDRIVITDLDDDDWDADDADDAGELSVNSALLNHIKDGLSNDTIPRELPLPDTSKALVLFRPLVVPEIVDERRCGSEGYDRVDEVVVEDEYSEPSPITDDDAMDIEYL